MLRRICLGLVMSLAAGAAVAGNSPEDGPEGMGAPVDPPASGWSLETTVGLVSDYRYRGVSLSDERPAVQASVGVTHESGVHAEIFATTIDEWGVGPDGDGAQVEVDYTLGWAFSAGGLDFDLAVAAWTYPDGTDVSYVEFPVSVSRTLGSMTYSLGVEYAPAQKAQGDKDNSYVWVGADWAPEDSPWSVTGWVGYEDGAWAPNGKVDWALGVFRAFGPVSVGLTYVDTDQSWADATVVAELKATF